MLPIYFGDPKKALFGMYHPSKQARARPISAVLCHPFGSEYAGAYRTMRVLAEQLSAAGISVLRFDYFGTGDSAGSSTEPSVAQWLKDVETAIVEVQGASDTTRTSLIGLRLGGTLASLAAATRDDIDRVVLWEPVLDGEKHVAEHLAMHEELLKTGSCRAEDSTEEDAFGYPLPEHLRRELKHLDLFGQTTSTVDNVLLLLHTEERRQRDGRLNQLGKNVEQKIVNSTDCWFGRTVFDQPLVSTEAVQSIVSWMAGEA